MEKQAKIKVILGCILAGVLTISAVVITVKNHQDNSDVIPFPGKSVLNPLGGATGKDVRVAGQRVDFMYEVVADRMQKAADECDRLGIKGERRSRLVTETSLAGRDAIKKVSESGYTAPFEPKFPPLPN